MSNFTPGKGGVTDGSWAKIAVGASTRKDRPRILRPGASFAGSAGGVAGGAAGCWAKAAGATQASSTAKAKLAGFMGSGRDHHTSSGESQRKDVILKRRPKRWL